MNNGMLKSRGALTTCAVLMSSGMVMKATTPQKLLTTRRHMLSRRLTFPRCSRDRRLCLALFMRDCRPPQQKSILLPLKRSELGWSIPRPPRQLPK